MTSIFPLGAMIGPVLGGVIVTFFTWRLIFFINVPIGLVLIAMLWWLLPPDPVTKARTVRIDSFGTGLFALTIVALMLGLNELGQLGWRSAVGWSILLVAVVLGGAFWRRQAQSPYAVLPLALLKQRQFAVVNVLNLLYGAAALGIFSLVPLYAQSRFGMAPLQAGALLTIRAASMAFMSTVTALLVLQRFGYRRPMLGGFVLVGLGLLLLSVAPTVVPGFAWLTLSCIVSGLGVGLAGPPSNNASLQLMPHDVAAMSGLRAMFRQLGGIVSLSITAAVIAGSTLGPQVLIYVFAVLGILTLIGAPLTLGVPENQPPTKALDEPNRVVDQYAPPDLAARVRDLPD
jgi:MFS family permease